MTATVTTPAADDQVVLWHNLPSDEVCRRLDVDPAVGLSASDVAERRARYGSNKLAEEAPEPAWKAFLRQYRDLMQLVLVGAAVVSIVAIQDFATALVVLGLTVLNAVMGLHQEGKAAASVAALRQMLIMTANVRARRPAASRSRPRSWCPATSSGSRPATRCPPTVASWSRRRWRSRRPGSPVRAHRSRRSSTR